MSAFTDLLADLQAEKRFLCQLDVYDVGGAVLRSLYYSSHGFTSEPADTPANQYYDARLKVALDFARSIFAPGKLSGRSIPGYGHIALNNSDGGLDALVTYAWGGRRVRVWLGGKDFTLSQFGLIFDGTAQGLSFADGEITVELRDLQYLFDREIQATVFAGSGGAEGGADVANKRKPKGWGVCRGVSPIYLGADTGKHMWAIGDSAIVGVLRVLDGAIPLTFNSGTPGPGEWTCDLTAATVTLGGTYVGPVTVDFVGTRYLSATSSTSISIGTGSKTFTVSAGLALKVGMKLRVARTSALSTTWMDGKVTSYSGTSLVVNMTSTLGAGTFTNWTISPWGTVGGILKAIATGFGVTGFASTVAALDTTQPATVNYWVPEGGNGLSVLDAIADGASCFYGFDRSASFDIGRLSAPGTSAASYDSTQLITLDRQATDEPNYQVLVRYQHNWTPMTANQILGAATAADRDFAAAEWRQSSVTNSSVLTAYPLSKAIEVNGIFDEQADADAEATRLAALFGVRRDYFKAKLKIQPLSTNLAATNTVTRARYGLDAGKDLCVVDLDENMDTFEVELGLWG